MIVKGTILQVIHEDMIEHVTQVCPLRSRWLHGYVVWCEVSLSWLVDPTPRNLIWTARSAVRTLLAPSL
jgi:hypothetical protein